MDPGKVLSKRTKRYLDEDLTRSSPAAAAGSFMMISWGSWHEDLGQSLLHISL